MPEKQTELTQHLASSETWGQGGDFVFDPSTRTRKPAPIPPRESVDSNVDKAPTDKAAAGTSETATPNKSLGATATSKKG
ncbi:hypothetical protein [Limnohabitans sp.]|uniref:hypothetical protein n=1 Tax=Limnohabitans sp. TaxID=1907725 RepID=UPI00286EF7C8|nr:hypothetical protein [Limnohabitans sp.]